MSNRNKLLLIGQFSKDPEVYCYADSFTKSFTQLGFLVTTFAYYPPRKNNLFQRLLFFLWRIFINLKLLIFCWWHQPQIIFSLKAEAIYSKTISLIKKYQNIQLIWFYPDSPFIFWNDNSNSEMLKVLPQVDLYLSWSKQLIPLLEHAGAKNVIYFPFGYDPNIFTRTVLNEHLCHDECDDDFIADVLFVGTWSEEREMWLTNLIKALPELELHIFGTGWRERMKIGYPLNGYLYGDAQDAKTLPYLFSRAKIILNFLRPQNFDAHNMRSIEVPATGNFLLAERSKEQAEELFKEGTSIICFSSLNELIEKINYYLVHEKERKTIAEQGYKQAHSYQLDLLLKNIIKNTPLTEKESV